MYRSFTSFLHQEIQALFLMYHRACFTLNTYLLPELSVTDCSIFTARTRTQFTGQSTKVFMALLICLKQIEMEGNEEIPIIKYNTPNLLKCLWRCPGFISHKGLVLGFWPNHKKMPRDLYCQPHMQTLEHLWGKPALNRPFLHKQSEKTLNRCEVKLNGPKATGSHFLLRYHFENRESAKKILKQPISSRIQLFSNSSKCVV